VAAVSGTAVTIERDGRIGRITLSRPDAMNAVDLQLASELDAGLEQLGAGGGVVVIRGDGGNFCAGGDFAYLQEIRRESPDNLPELFEVFGRALARIATLPAVVVAVVEGYAMAGGFELMQACDIAVVRADARIGDNHANFDQIPGGGSTQRLPRLIGRQRAAGLILSGERLSGAEAAEWGLAYRSFAPQDFEAGVEALAERLAGVAPETLAATKRLIVTGLGENLADGLAAERAAVVDHILGPVGGRAYEDFKTEEGDGA
jgi:enoyl-CoA hydratase/carnithine racemase